MALVSTVFPPEVWSRESLMVLRDKLVMAQLVHRSFEADVAQYGDIVHTRKPVKLPVKTWGGQTGTDANEQIEVENLNAKNLSITLDTVAYTAFLVEDRDAAISMLNLKEEFIIPAIDPLAQRIDDDIMSEYCSTSSTDVNSTAITAIADDTVGLGAAMDADDIIVARKQLAVNQCPLDNLNLVVCPTHEANLLGLSLFQQASQAGSADALRNANLGRAFGFNVFMSQNVPNAVDTDATSQSLAFHRNAIALVTRPLAAPAPGLGAQGSYASIDGISLRVVTAYDARYKGTLTTFDILYGVQLLDAKLGVIINP